MFGKLLTGVIGATVGAEIVKDAYRASKIVDHPTVNIHTTTPAPQVQTVPIYQRGGQPTLNGVYTGGNVPTTTPPPAPAPRLNGNGVTVTVTSLRTRLNGVMTQLGLAYDDDESELRSGEHQRLYWYGQGYRVRVKIWRNGRVEIRVQNMTENILGIADGQISGSKIYLTSRVNRLRNQYGMQLQAQDIDSIFDAVTYA
jgi:hypothetical protein